MLLSQSGPFWPPSTVPQARPGGLFHGPSAVDAPKATFSLSHRKPHRVKSTLKARPRPVQRMASPMSRSIEGLGRGQGSRDVAQSMGDFAGHWRGPNWEDRPRVPSGEDQNEPTAS